MSPSTLRMNNTAPAQLSASALVRPRYWALLLGMLFTLSGCAELGVPKGITTPRSSDYEQVITVLNPIENLPISISHEEGIRYHVRIRNTSATLYKLIWDDCTYVSTSGISIRLVRIYGKKYPDNLHAPQASSPIAARSEFQADFSGDRWIELAMEGGVPKPKDALRKGRFSLVFEVKGKRVEWQGEMAFIPKKQRVAR